MYVLYVRMCMYIHVNHTHVYTAYSYVCHEHTQTALPQGTNACRVAVDEEASRQGVVPEPEVGLGHRKPVPQNPFNIGV